jgi:hypothetical protein
MEITSVADWRGIIHFQQKIGITTISFSVTGLAINIAGPVAFKAYTIETNIS